MSQHDIILVNEKDEETGTGVKMDVHYKALLNRAFSVFIFNDQGEMLLQRRALTKYHSGGLWTNACCSHPRPGETSIAGAQRRLKEELGFAVPLTEAFEFVYKAVSDNGLTENEFDHVFTGEYNGIIMPDPAEVMDYCYKPVEDIKKELLSSPSNGGCFFLKKENINKLYLG